jgi:two-component system nitrogen regulation response regulator GlnG
VKTKAFRILVVDPDPISQKGIEDLFSRDQVSFFFCEQLAEAIKAMKAEDFDCAIVDVQVGGGKEAAQILQALDPSLPIILTTERNTRDLEIGAYQQHAFYYFVKPFGGEELKLAVQEALKKSNPEQPLPG